MMPTHRFFAFALFLVATASACAAGREPPPASPAPVTDVLPGASNVAMAAQAGHGAAPDAPGVEKEVERKIIRDATLTIEVRKEKQIPEVLRAVHETTGVLGGYVASETTHGIVIKVPSRRLDEALLALRSLGHITKREISARDVTSDYVDLDIRIDNARRLLERLNDLMKRTEDVARILDIEKELAKVTLELERLEGQMRLMKNQTAFATITLSVEESVDPGPVGWIFVGLYKGVKWLFVWD